MKQPMRAVPGFSSISRLDRCLPERWAPRIRNQDTRGNGVVWEGDRPLRAGRALLRVANGAALAAALGLGVAGGVVTPLAAQVKPVATERAEGNAPGTTAGASERAADSASAAARSPTALPIGSSDYTFANGAEPIRVFAYRPATYRDGPLIVVFHGVARNAEDYRNFAINLAERARALVVTPLFDRERFPMERYQRGGITRAGKPQPREAWTYAVVPRLVADVRAKEGRPELPYYYLGHSAGGQFLVRLAAFLPEGPERIIAANPGSHLFPTREAEFGYGFGGLPSEWSDDASLRRYLAAPLTLYLGTADTDPHSRNLDRSAAALRQGASRYERGRACFAFAQALAEERGWTFGWRLAEAAGIGHDAAEMFAAPEAMDAVFARTVWNRGFARGGIGSPNAASTVLSP
jgi:poly(3-hydroxybutyrate) depolymerase